MELIDSAKVPTSFQDLEAPMRDLTNLMHAYKVGLKQMIDDLKQLESENT